MHSCLIATADSGRAGLGGYSRPPPPRDPPPRRGGAAAALLLWDRLQLPEVVRGAPVALPLAVLQEADADLLLHAAEIDLDASQHLDQPQLWLVDGYRDR